MAGLVVFAQSQPWVRHALESVIGSGPTNTFLAVTGATTAALAQGLWGCWRMARIASRKGWSPAPDRVVVRERARPGGGAAVPEVHDHPGRPVPLPDGPVEHYERQALKASAAGFATGALATRNLR